MQDVLTCISFIWSEFVYLVFPTTERALEKIDFLRPRLHMALIVGLPEKAHRHSVSLFICLGKVENGSYPEFLLR